MSRFSLTCAEKRGIIIALYLLTVLFLKQPGMLSASSAARACCQPTLCQDPRVSPSRAGAAAQPISPQAVPVQVVIQSQSQDSACALCWIS